MEHVFEIIQVTKNGSAVDIIRDTVGDSSAAELKRAMLSGIEHEQFIIRQT